jgi:cobalt/nickel transport system permease protein
MGRSPLGGLNFVKLAEILNKLIVLVEQESLTPMTDLVLTNLAGTRFMLHWLPGLPPQLAMHVPDGFLSVPVSLTTWAVAIALIAVALRRVQAEYKERTVPLMGVCAAFIFAAQMINFPIPGGTSGHLLGGTLAGVLLGPWAGSLVMTVVFIVQGTLFQDGGLTVLGANVFNMGLIGTFGGYYLYRGLRSALGFNAWRGTAIAVTLSAWTSVVVASLICAFELALSGTVPLAVAITAMVGWHILIGIGEALITVVAIGYIWRTRPDMLYDPPQRSPLSRPLVNR